MKALRALSCLLSVLVCVCMARADAQRVVVVEEGDALTRALRVALASWPIEMTTTTEASLATGVLSLAEREQAAAVVWLVPVEAGVELNVYVAARGQSETRLLHDAVPLADDAAAAAALTVKTLLRHTAIAPEPERTIPVPEPAPAPMPEVPELEPPPVMPRTPARPLARIEVGAGLRSPFASSASPAPDLSAALAMFDPWWTARHLSVTADASFAFDDTLHTPLARGDLRAFALRLGARAVWPLSARVELDGALLAGMQRTRLRGTRSTGSDAFDARRLNAVLGGALGLDVWLTRHLYVAARANLERALRTQRYLVGTSPVLAVSPWSVEGSLRVGAAL